MKAVYSKWIFHADQCNEFSLGCREHALSEHEKFTESLYWCTKGSFQREGCHLCQTMLNDYTLFGNGKIFLMILSCVGLFKLCQNHFISLLWPNWNWLCRGERLILCSRSCPAPSRFIFVEGKAKFGSYDTGFNPTGFGLKHYWHTLTTVSYVIFQKILLYFTLVSPYVVLNLAF